MDLQLVVDNFVKEYNRVSDFECIAGICEPTPLDEGRPLKSNFVPFVSQDIRKRVDPSAILSGVKSIIVIGVGNTISTNPHQEEFDPLAQAELSSLGAVSDYHIRVRDALKSLVVYILTLEEFKHKGDFKHKILVDSPTLDERAFAERAGLGFFGRNGLIISPRFGTRFNIGLLLTDIPSATTKHELKQCPDDCRRCIQACPTGALRKSGILNTKRCISYLTQKENLTPEEQALIGNQLYGCDVCQNACPFNSFYTPVSIDPKKWMAMTDDEFATEYGHTSILWRGASILRRNAQAVYENISTP